MTSQTDIRPDWAELWRSGALPRLCFISLGITFHAGAENMISTIMPAMVRDIGGVQLTGWSFAIYEIGSIIAGAATGRLCTFWTVRTNMIVAALVFALGTFATALSPSMYWALGGRLLSGFGGGALIALSFVAVQRYFDSRIWPQLMAILSVVWGVTAFGGPLYGGLAVTLLSWRWAFALFAVAAIVFAIACAIILRNEPEPSTGRRNAREVSGGGTWLPCAWHHGDRGGGSGNASCGGRSACCCRRCRNHRIFHSRPSQRIDPAVSFGAHEAGQHGGFRPSDGGALSISTCSFGFYGPLLLAALHDFSPVTTGLIIASEAVSWSILSILVANAPKRHEALIVRAGALMIAAGVGGFAWAVPSGSVAGILFFATLQGGGFGILWPFANRLVIEAAPPNEKEITASGFSTLQRIGYATGGATAGIIANFNGFSGGFTKETRPRRQCRCLSISFRWHFSAACSVSPYQGRTLNTSIWDGGAGAVAMLWVLAIACARRHICTVINN